MKQSLKYRCEAASPEAVVQLIAASYLRHGYYWYVTGKIPDGKPVDRVDRKLIDKYGIDVTEWQRSKRRKAGIANSHYLRHDRWFILMLTAGHHPLRGSTKAGGEGEHLRDCRRVPIRFSGYSISYRRSGLAQPAGQPDRWHAHVRIDSENYSRLKAHFESIAVHRSPENLAEEFRKIPYARYAPVRRQLLNILRRVNDQRKQHSFKLLPFEVLKLRRSPVKVYVDAAFDAEQAAGIEMLSQEGHGQY